MKDLARAAVIRVVGMEVTKEVAMEATKAVAMEATRAGDMEKAVGNKADGRQYGSTQYNLHI